MSQAELAGGIKVLWARDTLLDQFDCFDQHGVQHAVDREMSSVAIRSVA